jgi:hypothetical protein
MPTTNEPINLIEKNQSIVEGFYNNTSSEVTYYIHQGMEYFLVIVLVIYTIVAFMAIKQIGLMTRTIKSSTNKYIYFIGYAHLIAVLLCLVFAIIGL